MQEKQKQMTPKSTRQMLEKTFVQSAFNPDIVAKFSPELKAALGDRYAYLSDGAFYVHFENRAELACDCSDIFRFLILEIRANLDLAKLIDEIHMGCPGTRWEIPVEKDQRIAD